MRTREKGMKYMKILAIDASTKSTGWCVGENGILQQHGCITASSRDVVKRIIKMRDQLSKIIKSTKIDKIIMEQVRPEYNSHTNKVLMWMQAVIVVAAYQIDPKIQCEFIGASTWRAAIKIKQGRGIKRESLKSQDIEYAQQKYNLTNLNDDEADAICIFDAYWEKNDNEINWE